MRLCRARGCPREIARELVQEAHMLLLNYQRAAKVRDSGSLLRRIVINLSINYYHRELPRVRAERQIDALDARGLIPDPAAGPEAALDASQELDAIANRIAALSPRTCQIFIAHRAGYSYEEIARAFVVKPRTVEKHVTSAMLVLGQESKRESLENPGVILRGSLERIRR